MSNITRDPGSEASQSSPLCLAEGPWPKFTSTSVSSSAKWESNIQAGSVRGLNLFSYVALAFAQPVPWKRQVLHRPGCPVTLIASQYPTAATFMEHWKRKQMRLNYRWDLTGFEEEEVSGCVRPTQAPLCHLLWLTWTPQVPTGPRSQARLLWLLRSSLWYSLVARATVFHLPVFSVSMLPKT